MGLCRNLLRQILAIDGFGGRGSWTCVELKLGLGRSGHVGRRSQVAGVAYTVLCRAWH